jgi:hypothetical protein
MGAQVSRVSFLRHAAFFSPEFAKQPLNIIGCGAMGSHIAVFAAKMGYHHFRLWDMDVVEEHNLPNQAFDLEHVGTLKVNALKAVLERFNPDVTVEVHTTPFDSADADLLEGPVVMAVDSMKARGIILDAAFLNPKVDKVFETRLGFDYGEVNVLDNMNPSQVKNFRTGLIDDDKVPEGPCNLRICTTLVGMVSSWTVHTLCEYQSRKAKAEPWDLSGKKYMFSIGSGLTTFTM